jgi:hypothetical protein
MRNGAATSLPGPQGFPTASAYNDRAGKHAYTPPLSSCRLHLGIETVQLQGVGDNVGAVS